MRIAILGLFRQFDAGYALAVGWKERAKMLEYFEQDFIFFVQENCAPNSFPHQCNIIPNLGHHDSFDAKVEAYTKCLVENFGDFDCILTSDLIYQRKGNFLPMNQAMRNAAPQLKAKWFHWVHSGCVSWREVPYPESLRYMMMEKSTLVYMNECDKAGLAKMYRTKPDKVAYVYNAKDIRSFREFSPISWEITKRLGLWKKDFIQILPLCSTRMDSKGISEVIFIHARLKAAGHSVALIIANSHYNTLQKQIIDGFDPMMDKKKQMDVMGLVENEDYVWTSDLCDGDAAPRKVISDLMSISNIFVFASWREVCPNVLLEAKISGCKLIVNSRTQALVEFAGPDALFFEADSMIVGKDDSDPENMQRMSYRAGKKDYIDKTVVAPLSKIKDAVSKRHQWEFSYEQIWNSQMKPLLYGVES